MVENESKRQFKPCSGHAKVRVLHTSHTDIVDDGVSKRLSTRTAVRFKGSPIAFDKWLLANKLTQYDRVERA